MHLQKTDKVALRIAGHQFVGHAYSLIVKAKQSRVENGDVVNILLAAPREKHELAPHLVRFTQNFVLREVNSGMRIFVLKPRSTPEETVTQAMVTALSNQHPLTLQRRQA